MDAMKLIKTHKSKKNVSSKKKGLIVANAAISTSCLFLSSSCVADAYVTRLDISNIKNTRRVLTVPSVDPFQCNLIGSILKSRPTSSIGSRRMSTSIAYRFEFDSDERRQQEHNTATSNMIDLDDKQNTWRGWRPSKLYGKIFSSSGVESKQYVIDDYLESISTRYNRLHDSEEADEDSKWTWNWLHKAADSRKEDDALYVFDLAGLASKRLLQKHHVMSSSIQEEVTNSVVIEGESKVCVPEIKLKLKQLFLWVAGLILRLNDALKKLSSQFSSSLAQGIQSGIYSFGRCSTKLVSSIIAMHQANLIMKAVVLTATILPFKFQLNGKFMSL